MKKMIVAALAFGFLTMPAYAQDAFEQYENSVSMTCTYKKPYSDEYIKNNYRFDGEKLYLNGKAFKPETQEDLQIQKKEGQNIFLIKISKQETSDIEYFLDFESTRAIVKTPLGIKVEGSCY